MPNKANWVDIKTLKQTVRFEDVLCHYGVDVKAKGKQHHGKCPLPSHAGKPDKPSFSANLEKGIFQCFGCGAKGNLLDFAILMSCRSPDNPRDIRRVALDLKRTFIGEEGDDVEIPKVERPKEEPKADETRTVINPPLDFELKKLDFEHPYLRNRRFTEETIQSFGLGYCSKGYIAGRIAIPLHDQEGKLIGYGGRIVDDSLISKENPKYKLPGTRVHKGVKQEFRKSEFLYAGHRMESLVDELIVVEGFPSVWWLSQSGHENVVALMGSSCSEKQADLIVSLVRPLGRVWIVPDADESGERCADSVLRQVSPHHFVRWVKLDPGKQPTDLSVEQLNNCFKI